MLFNLSLFLTLNFNLIFWCWLVCCKQVDVGLRRDRKNLSNSLFVWCLLLGLKKELSYPKDVLLHLFFFVFLCSFPFPFAFVHVVFFFGRMFCVPDPWLNCAYLSLIDKNNLLILMISWRPDVVTFLFFFISFFSFLPQLFSVPIFMIQE